MKQRFSAITQVSLAVLLALSLSFVTAGPSMAQESPEQSASIYPEGAKYDLDAPEDFVSTKITWGIAKRIVAITDDEGDLTVGSANDYIVLVNTLLILNRYLNEKLTEERKSVALNITFDDDTDATFTITAVRTHPTIDPEHAYYNVVRTADVETTITWRGAKRIEFIEDGDHYELEENMDYTVTPIDEKTHALSILSDPYLEGKLTAKNQSVVLTIRFDFGDDATLNITATNKPQPSISPTEAKYDLDNPAPVSTTITWGAAAKPVDAIAENDILLAVDVDYTVEDIDDDGATLTINDSYLKDRLSDIDDNVVLTIRFDVGDPAGFTITAIGTHPTIDPEDAIYDLADLVRPAAVNTTITWHNATEVVSVVDNGYKLELDDDYSVTHIDDETDMLTINDSYLNGKLEKWGDEVQLAIEFDFGSNRTLTIRAIDAHPKINADETEYDLNDPDDVTATITWQHPPTEVVSIVDGDDYELEKNVDYAVIPIDDGTATLKIDRLSYLRFKMTEIGEEVALTIAFNVGDDEKFAITAVRYSRIDPDEAYYYNWDAPSDFLAVNITWGTVSKIDTITDSKGSNLTEGENGDYIILGSTLVILNEYLRHNLSDLKPVTLTIRFSDGASADFTVTAIGRDPIISPSLVPYARHAPHDVATTITWRSATKVEFIVDDEGQLGENVYNVTRIYGDDGMDTGTARLTIFHDPYLEHRFEDSGTTSVKLTVGFDVGDDRIFEIDTGCFIATAAYGTPMAEQIQILREFRDEYLVTNSLGQGLVDIYYSISPSIADFIAEHPGLKPIVRAGLVPAVAVSTVAVNTGPAEKAAIVGLLVLVSAAVAVWAARRRSRRPKCT